jgi:hypothetical protein
MWFWCLKGHTLVGMMAEIAVVQVRDRLGLAAGGS